MRRATRMVRKNGRFLDFFVVCKILFWILKKNDELEIL